MNVGELGGSEIILLTTEQREKNYLLKNINMLVTFVSPLNKSRYYQWCYVSPLIAIKSVSLTDSVCS